MGKREEIRERFEALAGSMNERDRRLWCAAEAKVIGRGGLMLVAAATGVSPRAIGVGKKELATPPEDRLPLDRVRAPGAGRPRAEGYWPELPDKLEELVSASTRGDPQSALRWTTKSLARLSKELTELGYRVSVNIVARLLKAANYSLQANRKVKEGSQHPDRDAQFQHIADDVATQLNAGEPVISVDAKKKELVGEFKNGGREWHKRGDAPKVSVYDFIDKEKGRAVPYGVYDLTHNEGWVSVGVSADTAEFSVGTIRRWWEQRGVILFPGSKTLTITADGGGSNGTRVRLWKLELQILADETGLTLRVHHLPPGTSKWNKIEHKLFSFITINWRGTPLTDYSVIVNLIASTTTTTGLKVFAEHDPRLYEKGRKVTDAEMAALNIHRHEFHGEWNYEIRPRKKPHHDPVVS